MGDFRMPSLGADMDYATLVAWRVRPGDAVSRGDVVAEVETQKGVVEAELFEDGVVDELLVEVGTRVPVGTVMARIRSRDGAAAPADAAAVAARAGPMAAPAVMPVAPPPVAPPPAAPPPAAPPPAVLAPTVPVPAGAAVVRASPAARRLAAARGLELARIAGTGPDGAVTLADVERAEREGAPASPLAPAAAATVERRREATPLARHMAEDLGVELATVPGTGEGGMITKADVERAVAARAAPRPDRAAAVRQAIAAAMSRSNREIPHYHLSTDIEVSAVLAWLERENASRPVTERLLPAALFLKAIARALRETPELNGFWTDDALHPAPAVHLGVAIALRGGGLVAPAIHDADTLPLGALMEALRGLVQRARTGMLRSSELTDATVTVTNLGDLGVQAVFGVIYPPQVALVGIGRVAERAWAEGGLVGARPVVTVTLSADHRASDGHSGARFLTALERLLRAPDQL